jgi:hypothetical protein
MQSGILSDQRLFDWIIEKFSGFSLGSNEQFSLHETVAGPREYLAARE